jgi:hypothetical protein
LTVGASKRSLRFALGTCLVGVIFALPRPVGAQDVALRGTVNPIWIDAPTQTGVPAGEEHVEYLLTTDDGQRVVLSLTEAQRSELARRRGHGRTVADVSGRWLGRAAGAAGETRILEVRSLRVSKETADGAAFVRQGIVGRQPWVLLLCRFADISGVPHERSWYEDVQREVSDYWGNVSYDLLDMSDSRVVGWVDLPEGRFDYLPTGHLLPEFFALADDCLAAADTAVYFPDYYGVAMQFNADFPTGGLGGLNTLSVDGVSRTFGVTWQDDRADFFVHAHEMGHGLGLPHSSGPYGNVYDSYWDIMSANNVGPGEPHTIAEHKAWLGWIATDRKFVATVGTRQTIEMVRLADPPPTDGYLLAEIPLPDGSLYSVEARRFVGYDTAIPLEGVLLHHVESVVYSVASVVDVDGNGDPNDSGAAWTPGETFYDEAAGVEVHVERETPDGYTVTIGLDARPEVSVSRPNLIVQVAKDTPGSTDFEIRNSGSGRLEFELVSDAAWLTPDATSAALQRDETADVTVAVDPSGLESGEYHATITILGNATNGPLEFPVIMHVKEGPVLDVEQGPIVTRVRRGAPMPLAPLVIRNPGDETLTWEAKTTIVEIDRESGELEPGEQATLQYRFPDTDIGALLDPYFGFIRFTTNETSVPMRTVSLRLVVEQGPVGRPMPKTFELVVAPGADPALATMQLENSGVRSLHWTLSADDDWIVPVPDAGDTGESNPGKIELRVGDPALPVGTYDSRLVLDGDGGNLPIDIPVRLVVTDAGILKVPDATSARTVEQRHTTPPAIFQLENVGLSPVTWTVTPSAEWLRPAVTEGVLATGARVDLEVGVESESLAPGMYNGVVSVNGDAYGPALELRVVLIVEPITIRLDQVVSQLLGGPDGPDAGDEAYLDELGNENGRLDVGDLQVWLESSK